MNKWLTSTVEAYKETFGYTDHPIVWDVGSRDGDDGVELAERIFSGNADVGLAEGVKMLQQVSLRLRFYYNISEITVL